jgi:NADPH:quinone reductase-like Zn-dependent oxidoreductase
MVSDAASGNRIKALGLWYAAKGVVDLRPELLPSPGEGEGLVRMLYSGVSRGTERLVLEGAVPESEWQRMRAPLQRGDFPFPVMHGYCAVGVVEEGPAELIGRVVFCLHPHQARFVAPLGMLLPVPDGVPPRRATLAANMETALNALWDSGAGPADRIVVIGAGIVGLLVARLAARLPGAEVIVADLAPQRREIVEAFDACFVSPEAVPGGADVVFHASASAAGLAAAIGAAGNEATVVELSWYGDRAVTVPLGGAFHSQRLRIVGSQVGQVAANHRARWTYRRRLEAALDLLDDPALDLLLDTEIAFADAPSRLPALLARDAPGLAPILVYPS